MVSRDPEQLKKYLALVTGKQGGIEAVIDRLPREVAEGGGFRFPMARSAEALRGGMEAVVRDRPLSDSEMFGLEAIINAEIRPAVDIVDGKFQVTHPLWTHLSTDAGIRGRLEDTIPSVGRIELPGDARYPYGGTGFLVGERLLMTNRHVAAIFARSFATRFASFASENRL